MTILATKISRDHGLTALVSLSDHYEVIQVDLRSGLTTPLYHSETTDDACYRGIRKAFRSL